MLGSASKNKNMKNRRVVVIAEAGVNHNGELPNALRLIEIAAEAGADYVKFQTFSADKIVSHQAVMADYQKQNLNQDDTQWNMLKKLEIPEAWYPLLIQHCKDHRIEFLSTGFDPDAIDFLMKWNLPFIKIPSGELTNLPFLRHVARKKLPVVLSTGMADMEEVKWAVNTLISEGLKSTDLTVLHCNTDYPTKMEDVNLNAMQHLAKELAVKVGYSDHTLGIEVAIAAVALDACLIEKHFTINRNMPGPDHKASLEPEELKSMICAIRNIELAKSGNGIKEPSSSEFSNRKVARKSIHALRDLSPGDCVQENDIIALRPGDGISPMEWDTVVGCTIIQPVVKGEKLDWKCMERRK